MPKTAFQKSKQMMQKEAALRRVLRQRAGFPNLQDLGKALRRSPSYLDRIERRGGAPLVLAERLANLLRCEIEVFL